MSEWFASALREAMMLVVAMPRPATAAPTSGTTYLGVLSATHSLFFSASNIVMPTRNVHIGLPFVSSKS